MYGHRDHIAAGETLIDVARRKPCPTQTVLVQVASNQTAFVLTFSVKPLGIGLLVIIHPIESSRYLAGGIPNSRLNARLKEAALIGSQHFRQPERWWFSVSTAAGVMPVAAANEQDSSWEIRPITSRNVAQPPIVMRRSRRPIRRLSMHETVCGARVRVHCQQWGRAPLRATLYLRMEAAPCIVSEPR